MMTPRAIPPIALAVLLAGRLAGAQTNPAEVARRELLQQADTARAAGDHRRALDFAQRAGQLRMTTSVRLLLAQESEASGDHLAALDHATACVREAEADAALRNREQILDVCRALVTSVSPRVGSVIVRVASPPPGLVVRVAAHEVNPALYGVPFPVAPGEVSVEVSGDGIEAAQETVRVAAGARVEVTPRVRVIEHRVEPAAVGNGDGAVAAPLQHSEVVRTGPGAGPWVLVGVGAAAAVAGGVLLALAAGSHSDSNALCPNLTCNTEAQRTEARGLDDDYVTFWNAGGAVLGVGGAVLAGGLLWYAIAPRGEVSRRVSWSVVPTATGAMLGIGGAL
jgi:hypothetical protein